MVEYKLTRLIILTTCVFTALPPPPPSRPKPKTGTYQILANDVRYQGITMLKIQSKCRMMDNCVILIFILLVLSLTELGITCNDHGLSLLLNEDACKNVIKSLGSYYGGPQENTLYPSGCMLSYVEGLCNKAI